MKVFKLIKTYPGYPTLGVTAHKCGDMIRYEIKNLVGTTISFQYVYHIEICPEYWEEIISKEEYEILTYHCGSSNHIIKASQFTNSQFGGNSEWKIHSVKRLSDGEIFTIGDKVHLTNGNYYGFELKEFKFFTNGEKGHLKEHRNKTFLKLGFVSSCHKEPTFFYLEETVKTKQPLFKTEDGIDIFEGDDYWVYDYVDLKHIKSEIHKVNRASQTHTDNGINKKYFSTKENAEHFIIMNKPCLSINDVMGAGYGICNPRALLSIVNSKINEQTKN